MGGTDHDGIILQERDRRLLDALKTLRFLDRDQLMAIGGFTSVSRANARAKQLVDGDILSAIPVGTIGGGRKLVYTLSRQSSYMVGVPYRPLRREHTPALSGDPFLEHQLEIGNTYVAVAHRAPAVPDVTFLRWLSFSKNLVEKLPLIPDGYFEMRAAAGTLCCFLEIDMGTEAPKIWLTKIALYIQLAVSGDFQRHFGQERFRVLVITTTEKRMDAIRRAIRRSTEKIFWLSTFEQITGRGFWSPVWSRPTGDQRHCLI